MVLCIFYFVFAYDALVVVGRVFERADEFRKKKKKRARKSLGKYKPMQLSRRYSSSVLNKHSAELYDSFSPALVGDAL